VVFYQVTHCRNCKRLRELEEIEISRISAVDVTLRRLDFVQEIGL
jgi:hypothetical protein